MTQLPRASRPWASKPKESRPWVSGLFTALLALGLQLGAFLPEGAMARSPTLPAEVRLVQKLGAALPLELRFRDEQGRVVPLGAFFGKKPVILSLAYFRCPNLCTLVLNGLVESMSRLHKARPGMQLGADYDVITVSIDPREQPALALAKKRSYLARYGALPGAPWHFLTGDEASIRVLARAVGFGYAYDASSGEYSHPSGILVVTPRGRVSQYFYGIHYPAPALAASLRKATQSGVGTLAEEILLFCFHYDPRSSAHGKLVMGMIQIAGLLMLAALTILLLTLFRQEWSDSRRRRRVQ